VPQYDRTGCGGHAAYCLINIGDFSFMLKRLARETGHSLPPSAEVDEWRYPSIPLYAFIRNLFHMMKWRTSVNTVIRLRVLGHFLTILEAKIFQRRTT
jgi:hypothetical protein